MFDLTINPWSGTLQLIHKTSKKTSVVNKDGESTLNQIHIADSDAISKYTLPSNPKASNWIKIFGKGKGGWQLDIPKGEQVVCQNGMRILDHASYLHSNMHAFDFIHLVYLGKVWFIENKSTTVGISPHV